MTMRVMDCLPSNVGCPIKVKEVESKYRKEQAAQFLSEIAMTGGSFVGIDALDVEQFKSRFGDINATKVSGKLSDVEALLKGAVECLDGMFNGELMGLLCSIKVSPEGMSRMGSTGFSDAISEVGDNLDCCRWNVSVDKALSGDEIILIVVAGRR